MSIDQGQQAAAAVLAHGGGAPEAAMIGVPLLLFGVFFYLEKRARAREKDDQ
jgi:hypothetical protein